MAMRKEFLEAWFQDILRMQTEDQALTARSVIRRVGSWDLALTRIKACGSYQVIHLPDETLLPALESVRGLRELKVRFFHSQYILQFGSRPANISILRRGLAFLREFVKDSQDTPIKDLVPTIFIWNPSVPALRDTVTFFGIAKPTGEHERKMRRYTVEELIHMRDSLPFVICNLDRLTRDGDTCKWIL